MTQAEKIRTKFTTQTSYAKISDSLLHDAYEVIFFIF